MTDNSYYILRDGVKTGPFTYQELTDMGIEANTRVVPSAGNNWENAADLPEFYEYFEAQGHIFPTEDNLASFWWRLAAYVIDNILVLFLLSLIVPNLIMDVYNNQLNDTVTDAALMARLKFNLVAFAAMTIYNTLFEITNMRGSIGKKVCRIKVVDADGLKLTLGKALLRNSFKFISGAALCIGYLHILWDEHRQAWHDQVARTYVVRPEA